MTVRVAESIFVTAPSCPFYKHPAGTLSPWGNEALPLLESLASRGGFELEHAAVTYHTFFPLHAAAGDKGYARSSASCRTTRRHLVSHFLLSPSALAPLLHTSHAHLNPCSAPSYAGMKVTSTTYRRTSWRTATLGSRGTNAL